MPPTTNTDPKIGTYRGIAVDDLTCDACGKTIHEGESFIEDFLTICDECDQKYGMEEVDIAAMLTIRDYDQDWPCNHD